MVRLILIALAAVMVIVFTIANLHVVALKTVVAGEIRVPMAACVFGAFACGAAAMSVWNLQHAVRRRLRERAQMSQWSEAEASMLPPPPQVPWPEGVRKKGRLVQR